MQRMLVHGQQREPGVLGLGDRTAGSMLVDVADREVLEIAAEPLAIALLADLVRVLHHVPGPRTDAEGATLGRNAGPANRARGLAREQFLHGLLELAPPRGLLQALPLDAA